MNVAWNRNAWWGSCRRRQWSGRARDRKKTQEWQLTREEEHATWSVQTLQQSTTKTGWTRQSPQTPGESSRQSSRPASSPIFQFSSAFRRKTHRPGRAPATSEKRPRLKHHERPASRKNTMQCAAVLLGRGGHYRVQEQTPEAALQGTVLDCAWTRHQEVDLLRGRPDQQQCQTDCS